MARPDTLEHVVTRLRRIIGFRRKELADRIGISTSYLEKIERGEREMTEPIRDQIVAATGISPRCLVENNPAHELSTVDGHPFTRAEFDRWRAWRDVAPAPKEALATYLQQNPQAGFGGRPLGPHARIADPPPECWSQAPADGPGDVPKPIARALQLEFQKGLLRRRMQAVEHLLKEVFAAALQAPDGFKTVWEVGEMLKGLPRHPLPGDPLPDLDRTVTTPDTEASAEEKTPRSGAEKTPENTRKRKTGGGKRRNGGKKTDENTFCS